MKRPDGIAWRRLKPQRFDTNMVVIGAGSAGLVTAYIAALVKARVTLIEKHRMGGDCLNTGCVPSKALIRSAGVRYLLKRSREFGINIGQAETDFSAVMARVRKIIATVAPHDSIERYTALGVDCVEGEARITSPWTVRVNGREISTRHIVLATGARPLVPPIPGLVDTGYLTSDTVWGLQSLPRRLLVLGGGPIGCELAQAFARLGSKVALVHKHERIMPREDTEVSAWVSARFREEGIDVLTSREVLGVENRGFGSEGRVAILQGTQGREEIPYDEILVAIGRKANTEHLGLETLGVALNANGTVKVNEYLQTSNPNIFACGDVAGPYQFTHMAAYQAWFAAINGLFGTFKKFRINYRVVPWATFTDPEVARVGLNEQEAAEQGIAYEVTRYGIDDLDRAITDGEADGFVKVLTVPGKDRILGATIVGYHASDLLNTFILAMTHGLGLKKIMATTHVYPTMSEAVKFSASEWQKVHTPYWIFPFLERFHRWRRA